MKQTIASLLQSALQQLQSSALLPPELKPQVRVENSKDKAHGDFASNIALTLAKPAGLPPRKIAEMICGALQNTPTRIISKTEIAGPGFINFFVNEDSRFQIINEVISQGPELRTY